MCVRVCVCMCVCVCVLTSWCSTCGHVLQSQGLLQRDPLLSLPGVCVCVCVCEPASWWVCYECVMSSWVSLFVYVFMDPLGTRVWVLSIVWLLSFSINTLIDMWFSNSLMGLSIVQYHSSDSHRNSVAVNAANQDAARSYQYTQSHDQ